MIKRLTSLKSYVTVWWDWLPTLQNIFLMLLSLPFPLWSEPCGPTDVVRKRREYKSNSMASVGHRQTWRKGPLQPHTLHLRFSERHTTVKWKRWVKWTVSLPSHHSSFLLTTGTGRTEAGDTGQWGRWERSCNHFPRPPPVPHARLIVRLATQERRRTPRKRL